jgi:glycosyltransferase involved in cell wall biosynthesis
MLPKTPAKRLSICIPTFNRASSLHRLLMNISEEIVGFEQEIEICISDNRSSDSTWQEIQKWSGRLPIVASRNNSNLGLDVNFAKAVLLSNGNFVWLMGDDDVFVKGSLSMLLSDISRPEASGVGAIYINAATKRGLMSNLNFNEFRRFSKGDPACPPLNASFAGSLCIRGSLAKGIIRKKTRFKGKTLLKTMDDPHLLDYFAPSYFFLECLNKSGFLCIEPKPGVSIIADGEVASYEKKMYLDVTLTLYSIELERHYGWFSDGASNYNLNSFLVGAAIACQRQNLRDAYAISRKAYIRSLEKSGKKSVASILRFMCAVVDLPVAELPLMLMFKIAKRILHLKITDSSSMSRELTKRLEFAVQREKKALQQCSAC